jgi:hypothetical protein
MRPLPMMLAWNVQPPAAARSHESVGKAPGECCSDDCGSNPLPGWEDWVLLVERAWATPTVLSAAHTNAYISLSSVDAAVVTSIMKGLIAGRLRLPQGEPSSADLSRMDMIISGVRHLTPETRGSSITHVIKNVFGVQVVGGATAPLQGPLCWETRVFGRLLSCADTGCWSTFSKLIPPAYARCEIVGNAPFNECLCIKYSLENIPWWGWLLLAAAAAISIPLLIRIGGMLVVRTAVSFA